MTERKMFLFDVDGTLCNSKKEILESTKKAINILQNKGHVVSIVTGRCPIQTFDLIKQVGIKDWIVGCGGASIFNLNERNYYITKKNIPLEARELMLGIAMKYNRELSWSDGIKVNRVYFGKDPQEEITDELFFIGGSKRVQVYNDWQELKDKFYTSPMIQLSFKAESWIIEEEYEKLKKHLPAGVQCHETSRVYLELSPLGIDKFTGVKFLQKKLGISNENTYCFGDSGNDLPMIRKAGNGIAMGNATLELKRVAKYITDTNDEDGIYKFLESKGLLNEE